MLWGGSGSGKGGTPKSTSKTPWAGGRWVLIPLLCEAQVVKLTRRQSAMLQQDILVAAVAEADAINQEKTLSKTGGNSCHKKGPPSGLR